MLELDHLVLSTTDLDAGTEELEALFGVALEDGGRNGSYGTHSKLLSLGPDAYLELIAVDPNSRAPHRARWFALDRFDGKTRLTNWAVRTDELSHLMSLGAAGPGLPVVSSRNGLRWTMVVPEDGELPLDGISPALMEWRKGHHIAKELPDQDIRLQKLSLSHPKVDQPFLPDDARIETTVGDYAIHALLETPNGVFRIEALK
ncbi:MAG: VOC family protein [Pseudomonadota bacterium]